MVCIYVFIYTVLAGNWATQDYVAQLRTQQNYYTWVASEEKAIRADA
jgi:hypothetical protein